MHTGTRRRSRTILFATAATVALAIGGIACGSDKADISQAVQNANQQLAPSGARLTCPNEVDDSSAPFDCTVSGTNTGKTATVQYKLSGENTDTLEPANQDAYQNALQEVTTP